MLGRGRRSACSSDFLGSASGCSGPSLVVKDATAIDCRHEVCKVAGVVSGVYACTADGPDRLHTCKAEQDNPSTRLQLGTPGDTRKLGANPQLRLLQV